MVRAVNQFTYYMRRTELRVTLEITLKFCLKLLHSLWLLLIDDWGSYRDWRLDLAGKGARVKDFKLHLRYSLLRPKDEK